MGGLFFFVVKKTVVIKLHTEMPLFLHEAVHAFALVRVLSAAADY